MLHRAASKISTQTGKSNISTNRIMQSRNLHEVVIVSATRTPIGIFNGGLSSMSAPHLGAVAIKSALERKGISPKEVGEVILGNVLGAGIGQAPARQASLKAGIGEDVPCTTVNKVCSSGMKTIMFGAQSIMLGHQDCIVTGGFESMSNTPYYLDKARNGYRYGHGQLIDGVLKDGLTDVYNDIHMGLCAEDCATRHGITRKEQDDYAVLSYKRSAEAWKNGEFKNEITNVTISSKKGDIIISEDEEYKQTNYDKIPTLRSVFKKDGTITAANASKLNDGASCVILMSSDKAKSLNIKPLARIIGFADAEGAPIEFPTAPSKAIPKAMKMAGISNKDVDYWEVNEAFSVVALANQKLLNIDPSKLNVLGGGVSLGHPIGSSGARIVVTLTHLLHNRNAKIGVAGICNGGGGASSIVIEKL